MDHKTASIILNDPAASDWLKKAILGLRTRDENDVLNDLDALRTVFKPNTIETTLYQYAELEDRAKEKARDWYYQASSGDEWWESVYEDAEQAGIKITEFDIDRGNMIKGSFINSAEETAAYILANHGETCETHKTALKFSDNMSSLANMTTVPDNLEDLEDEFRADFKQSILEDYLSTLRKEYEFQTSQETIEENIEANEYTFTAEGNRFG